MLSAFPRLRDSDVIRRDETLALAVEVHRVLIPLANRVWFPVQASLTSENIAIFALISPFFGLRGVTKRPSREILAPKGHYIALESCSILIILNLMPKFSAIAIFI